MNAMVRSRATVLVLAVSAVLLGPAALVRAQLPLHDAPAPAAVLAPPAAGGKVYVADVIIQGNQLMASDRIKSGLLTRAGQEYNRDIIAEDVRRLVASKQFGQVEARETTDPAGNIIVFFRVSDYTNVVRRVVFVGAKHLSDKELYDLAGVREGTPLSPTRNKLACGAIIRKLQEMGRPYADCVLISGDKVGDDEVIFEITEGSKLAISAIEFTGNTFVSGAVLRTHIASSAKFLGVFGGTWNPMLADQDIAKLMEYYKAFGYLDVKVSRELQYHPNGRDVVLIFHVNEGTRYTLAGPPQWNGVKSINLEPIQEMSKVKEGEFFDQRAIEKDMARTKNYIGYTGREARVSATPIYNPDDPGIVRVVYDVEEQAPARFGRVIIIGNTRTKQNVILNALSDLEPGQVLTYPDLQAAERNLTRLNIFKSSPDGSVHPSVTVIEDPARPLSDTKDILVQVEEDNTGSLMFGVGVNSDAGLTGSIVLAERNFDLFRWPTSIDDLLSGGAFRGAGQEFRIEAVPGTQLQRYTISFREPHLFDTQNSLGVSGYYYNRQFNEYTEDRLGSRFTLGRKFGDFLTVSGSVRVEDVNVRDLPLGAPIEYTSVEGHNFQVGLKGTVTYDARDSFIRPTEGFLTEISYEQMLGDHTFPLLNAELDQYYTVWQRKDGSGRHVIALRSQIGWAADDTPVYEKFFAGGFRSLRGFAFRGVGPDNGNGFKTGGTFMLLNSAEYQVPILANEQLFLVAFVDSGTVEQGVRITDYRVSAGFGIRFTVPMLGPVPIALDFGFPIVKGPFDNQQVFGFYMGMTR
jgi:outer membrane protein assembly complex protein YaeT